MISWSRRVEGTPTPYEVTILHSLITRTTSEVSRIAKLAKSSNNLPDQNKSDLKKAVGCVGLAGGVCRIADEIFSTRARWDLWRGVLFESEVINFSRGGDCDDSYINLVASIWGCVFSTRLSEGDVNYREEIGPVVMFLTSELTARPTLPSLPLALGDLLSSLGPSNYGESATLLLELTTNSELKAGFRSACSFALGGVLGAIKEDCGLLGRTAAKLIDCLLCGGLDKKLAIGAFRRAGSVLEGGRGKNKIYPAPG